MKTPSLQKTTREMLGSVINQRYRLDGILGKGGMGAVYRAFDMVLERPVAVKLMADSGLGQEVRERLLAEARATARLNHPNIAAVYDAGETDGLPYIVMELIDGHSLHSQPPREIEAILSIAEQVCQALDHAHRNGIVHRDLKPENILLTGAGTAKLVDFGLARSIASRLSAQGGLVGTAFYIAPEQASGQAVDGRADLYALGVILYELTTGQLPFSADDPMAVISQHLYAPVVPPRARTASIPPALDGLIVRLLSKRPEDRPSTAEEARRLIEAARSAGPGGEATLDLVAEAGLSVLERISRGRFVGRRQELAEARALWRRAMAGQGHTFLVSGEPGVGKTRLVRELRAEAQVSSGLVLSAACYPEGGAPYSPIARILRGTDPVLRDLDLTDRVRADLISLAPELRSLFPDVPTNPHMEPQADQDRLHNSLASLLSALAARSPVLLFIDDVHWADGATLQLLRHLARNAAAMRMLLVLTYREIEVTEGGPLSAVLLDLNRERVATRVKLGRLSFDQTREMLEGMLNGRVGRRLVQGIYRETEGNPFFVEEVCKALIEDGELVQEGGHWHSRSEIGKLHIPQSVRQAIQARLARLPESAQEVLRIAAILGREFDFGTLRAACDVDEDALVSALEAAERAQLIEELPSGRPADRPGTGEVKFAFGHALIPTTLREGISGLRRQRLHRRAAEAIKSLRPEDYESLAYQYALGGDEERARSYYVQAGDRAARIPAMVDAARNYRAALEGWPEAEPAGRAETLFKLGNCLWVSADLAGTMRVFEEARAIFESLEDWLKLGDVERMIGRLHWESGDRGLALEHYHNALRILEGQPESVELARAVSSISQMHMLASEYDDAITWGERALAMGQRLEATDVIVHALNNVGTAYLQTARRHEGLPMLQESLRLAKEAVLPHDVCRAGLNMGEGFMALGRYPQAVSAFSDMLAYADKYMVVGFSLAAQVRLTMLDWISGQWSSALARRGEIGSWHAAPVGNSDVWAHTLFGHLENDLGRPEEALIHLLPDMTMALKSDEIQTTVPYLGELLRTYAVLNRDQDAAEMVRLLLGLIDRTPYLAHDSVMSLLNACYWVGTIAAARHGDLAPMFLTQLERAYRQLHNPEAEAACAEGQAVVQVMGGHLDLALEGLKGATRIWEESGRPYDQARALVATASVLEKEGDRDAARRPAARAHALLVGLAGQLEGTENHADFLNALLFREAARLAEPA